jgi:glycine oxidase
VRVIVVGGGVFGCCAAYQLAKSGACVTLLERDRIGAHASGRNPGNLNPILAGKPELVPLALESFGLHLTLAEELAALGCPSYGLEPVKRVFVAFDADDRNELDDVGRRFSGYAGFTATRLNAAALHSIDPRLSEAAREGLLIEGNKSLDSRVFNPAIAAGAQKAGAKVVSAAVLGLSHRLGVVSTVHTGSGDFPCDALVLATGPWVAETKDWLGIDLPVEPVKGEMLRVRLEGRSITHDFTHGIISLYRRGDDEVWVGVTREQCGFDDSPTGHGRDALIDGAARIMPAIRGAAVIEHLAALRPMTTSGLPIVGRAAGWSNVFVANGGGIKGTLLCTGIGVAIRDLVLTGNTTMPVAGFAQEAMA